MNKVKRYSAFTAQNRPDFYNSCLLQYKFSRIIGRF